LGFVFFAGFARDSLGTTIDKVILQRKEPSMIPIEADCINPDLLAELSQREIKSLTMFYGRRKVSLSDLFDVEGERSNTIIVQGDLSHVKRIGQSMR
jgi:formylmethanofuran dehydrogenase subunit C